MREAPKVSALLSGKNGEYNYFTGQEILSFGSSQIMQ